MNNNFFSLHPTVSKRVFYFLLGLCEHSIFELELEPGAKLELGSKVRFKLELGSSSSSARRYRVWEMSNKKIVGGNTEVEFSKYILFLRKFPDHSRFSGVVISATAIKLWTIWTEELEVMLFVCLQHGWTILPTPTPTTCF